MSQDKILKNLQSLTFEDALKELEEIVRHLEQGDTDLDNAIHRYERGMALRQFLNEKIKESKLKIEQITKKASGEIVPQTASFQQQ